MSLIPETWISLFVNRGDALLSGGINEETLSDETILSIPYMICPGRHCLILSTLQCFWRSLWRLWTTRHRSRCLHYEGGTCFRAKSQDEALNREETTHRRDQPLRSEVRLNLQPLDIALVFEWYHKIYYSAVAVIYNSLAACEDSQLVHIILK